MIIDFTNVNGGGGGSGYTLPVASQSTLGGVMVGSGLTITSAGTLSSDIDTSNFVQQSEMSGYVETSAMSGYATTDSLSGYVETSALSGYVGQSQLATAQQAGIVKIGSGVTVDSSGTISVSGSDVANYAMALKSVQEGDENNYKVANYGGLLYYVEDNKNAEENIFVKVRYDANYVNIDMDIDGQTDTDIMNIENGDFQVTISIDSEGNLFYVDENDEEVYYDSETTEYQYGDFTFNWENDGMHIGFSQQANYIEAIPSTDNCENWFCVGQNMNIANQNQLGLVKIGEGIDLAEDGTISVAGGGGGNVSTATTAQTGVVKIGNGINVDTAGTISVNASILPIPTGDRFYVNLSDHNVIGIAYSKVEIIYDTTTRTQDVDDMYTCVDDSGGPEFEMGFSVTGLAGGGYSVYFYQNYTEWDDQQETDVQYTYTSSTIITSFGGYQIYGHDGEEIIATLYYCKYGLWILGNDVCTMTNDPMDLNIGQFGETVLLANILCICGEDVFGDQTWTFSELQTPT